MSCWTRHNSCLSGSRKRRCHTSGSNSYLNAFCLQQHKGAGRRPALLLTSQLQWKFNLSINTNNSSGRDEQCTSGISYSTTFMPTGRRDTMGPTMTQTCTNPPLYTWHKISEYESVAKYISWHRGKSVLKPHQIESYGKKGNISLNRPPTWSPKNPTTIKNNTHKYNHSWKKILIQKLLKW